jgi:hypothetical protein
LRVPFLTAPISTTDGRDLKSTLERSQVSALPSISKEQASLTYLLHQAGGSPTNLAPTDRAAH